MHLGSSWAGRPIPGRPGRLSAPIGWVHITTREMEANVSDSTEMQAQGREWKGQARIRGLLIAWLSQLTNFRNILLPELLFVSSKFAYQRSFSSQNLLSEPFISSENCLLRNFMGKVSERSLRRKFCSKLTSENCIETIKCWLTSLMILATLLFSSLIDYFTEMAFFNAKTSFSYFSLE